MLYFTVTLYCTRYLFELAVLDYKIDIRHLDQTSDLNSIIPTASDLKNRSFPRFILFLFSLFLFENNF